MKIGLRKKNKNEGRLVCAVLLVSGGGVEFRLNACKAGAEPAVQCVRRRLGAAWARQHAARGGRPPQTV